MFSIFKKKPIDAEVLDWVIESYDWITRTVGPVSWVRRQPLITPTLTHFPKSEEVREGHQKAEWLFNTIKKQMGMEGWPVALEILDEDVDVKVSETVYLKNAPFSPAGDFSWNPKSENPDPVIRYNPYQLFDPINLIATFAHELSHYLLYAQPYSWPETFEESELLTDLTAVFCGYGIFLINSAFLHQANSDGSWRIGSQGYLTVPTLCFATALFCLVNDVDITEARNQLSPVNRKIVDKSYRYLQNNYSLVRDIKNIYP